MAFLFCLQVLSRDLKYTQAVLFLKKLFQFHKGFLHIMPVNIFQTRELRKNIHLFNTIFVSLLTLMPPAII